MEVDDVQAEIMSHSDFRPSTINMALPLTADSEQEAAKNPAIAAAATAPSNAGIDNILQGDKTVAAQIIEDRLLLPTRPYINEQEDIDFSAPPIGSLRFPNDLDARGSRVPFRKLHTRPDILPPASQPFFQQMQVYCQLWSTWAATIDDQSRRKEIIDAVTTKMLEAWKFGVLNGHYRMGAVEAAEKEQLIRQSKSDRRGRDKSKMMAPFAMETGMAKHHNIVNAELEKHGITFDMINLRIEKDDLSPGEHLLQVIKRRLGRSIEVNDWKSVTSRVPFKAGFHERNLLMYCLWEVSRCRKTVLLCQDKLAGKLTANRQRSYSDRVDINRTRAFQHLALAAELNLKEPVDEEDDLDVVEQSETQSVVEVDDDDAEMDATNYETEATKFHDVPEHNEPCENPDIDHEENHEITTLNEFEDYEVHGSFFDDALPVIDESVHDRDESLQMPELSQLTPEMELLLENGNRETPHDETYTNPESQTKRPKYAHDGMEISHNNVREQPQTTSDTHITHPDAVFPRIPLHEIQAPSQPLPTTNVELDPHSFETNDQRKKRYLTEIWQPKLSALLASRGHGRLHWPLSTWSDVRTLLQHLNIDVFGRNEYLREYKAGLAQRGGYADATAETEPVPVSMKQPPPQAPRLVLKLQRPMAPGDVGGGECSDDTVNETRGFAFRCLPSVNNEQRARLDDLVDEFVTDTITSRVKRHGLYVIIHDPEHPQRMPVAHGIWNTKDKNHPNGMDWFYNGQTPPRSISFKTAWHVYDFEALPPPTPRKPPKVRAGRINGHAVQGRDRGLKRKFDQQAYGRQRRAKSVPRTRSRAHTVAFDDDEGSEYDPNE